MPYDAPAGAFQGKIRPSRLVRVVEGDGSCDESGNGCLVQSRTLSHDHLLEMNHLGILEWWWGWWWRWWWWWLVNFISFPYFTVIGEQNWMNKSFELSGFWKTNSTLCFKSFLGFQWKWTTLMFTSLISLLIFIILISFFFLLLFSCSVSATKISRIQLV